MIGLLGTDRYWSQLLGQEGTWFETDALAKLDRVAVLVLDREPEDAELPRLRAYADAGGCVLACSAKAARLWPGLRLRRQRLGYILPDKTELFRNVGIVDLATRGRVPHAASHGLTPGRRPALFAGSVGRSQTVLLPFEPAEVLAGFGSGPKVFPARTPRPLFETVSTVSRGEVRRLVANCLRFLLAKRGLPYVRLASIPGGHAGLFGVRIDTDMSPPAEMEKVASSARTCAVRCTWFVHVEAAGSGLPALVGSVLAGEDVQLHCYRHRIYPDYRRNRADIETAFRLLVEAGARPVGIAAPYGQWNRAWNRAAEESGLEYSSEFAVGYDDLPFRPLIDGAPGRMLQVPVHPVSLGRLAAARAGSRTTVEYFRSLARLQAARHEPCIVYDHPATATRYEQEFRQVLFDGVELCGRTTTMTEYARWWREREKAAYRLRYEPDRLVVESEAGVGSQHLVIEHRGLWAAVPLLGTSWRYDSLSWRPLIALDHDINLLLAARRARVRVAYQETLRRLRRHRDSRRKP